VPFAVWSLVAWLGTVSVVFFVSAASSAYAQEPQRLVLTIDGALICQPMDTCTEDTCRGGETCGTVGENPDATYCHFKDDSFICCDSSGSGSADSDCTTVSSRGVRFSGVCVEIEGLEGASGVCEFPDERGHTYCAEGAALTRDQITACMTSPGDPGFPTDNWNFGDCDGDGVPNGREWTFYCDGCDREDYTLEDGGCSLTAASDAAVDANRDASRDASPTTGRGESSVFRGSGGCTCGATGGAPFDLGAWPFAALALLWAAFRPCRR